MIGTTARPAAGADRVAARVDDLVRTCLVVIPARNEEGRVEQVLAGLRATLPAARVLVVDDGSTDRTAQAAREAGAMVVSLPFNLGYGAALQTGYKFALRHGFTRVLQMDADGQHDPLWAPLLLRSMAEEEADVVIGSRYLGGAPPPSSPLRRIGTALFARIVSLATGTRITDPTSGFKALSLRALTLMTSEGFPDDFPDADVLMALHRSGCRLAEIPVQMHRRTGGVSMHSGMRFLYYGYKMSVSLLLHRVRRSSPYRREWHKARSG